MSKNSDCGIIDLNLDTYTLLLQYKTRILLTKSNIFLPNELFKIIISYLKLTQWVFIPHKTIKTELDTNTLIQTCTTTISDWQSVGFGPSFKEIPSNIESFSFKLDCSNKKMIYFFPWIGLVHQVKKNII